MFLPSEVGVETHNSTDTRQLWDTASRVPRDSYLRLSMYRSDASLHLLGTFHFLRCGMKEK